MSSVHKLLIEILVSRPFSRFLILLTSLIGTVFGIFGPFFQKEFIDSLMNQPLHLHQLLPAAVSVPSSPLIFLLFAFLSILVSLAMSALTNYLGARESILMQKVLGERLYKKTLELRSDSLGGRQVGEIVSIYAVDVPGATVFLDQTLPVGASVFFPLVLAPTALVLLFNLPLWPTVTLMFFVLVFNFIMAYRQSVFFFNFKKLAADRIGQVNEWVQNIRTLRILGWVRQFEETIFITRRVETQNRVQMVTNGQVMNGISSSITFFLNLAAISSLLYMTDEKITTGTLLAMLWIVGVFLTRPFRQMPWFFTFGFDSWTSLKRVDAFLSLQNLDPQKRSEDFQKLKTLAPPKSALKVDNLNLIIGPHRLLSNISLDIKQGEFVTIVGEVGSGKSLLLLSLLGETGASFGQYDIGENDALTLPLDQIRQFYTFVPQEGFIMSASLRENVAFEYGVNPQSDSKILESLSRSQFDLSTERVEGGLDTEIGERGVNLSGGQKQRVSLARVDYYQAPIVLLDDCLSAVDVDTENKLIDTLIKGAWQDRTRLLVTHRLTVLEKSDRVIFLKDGQIKAQGKFHELLATQSSFREYASSVAFEASKKSFSEQKEEVVIISDAKEDNNVDS